MAIPKIEFTAKWLASLMPAPPGARYEVADTHIRGLRVRVGESAIEYGKFRGRAAQVSFILAARFPPSTQPTRRILGSYAPEEPELTLQAARQKAMAWKSLIRTGVDPSKEAGEAAKLKGNEIAKLQEETARADEGVSSCQTLSDALDRYDGEKLAYLKRGTAVRRALDGGKGLLTALVTRDIKSITRSDIAVSVRARAKGSPISANRQVAYAKAFFNWCLEEELIDANPAATIKKPAPERQRDRFHTLEELKEIWVGADTIEYPFGPLFKLLITLPMRREEVTAIRVEELKLGNDANPGDAEWVLPADRTKRSNALRVPLSELSRSIIVAALADVSRPEKSPFVFTTTSETSVSGFTKARRRLDQTIMAARVKRANAAGVEAVPMPHWTIHDLRTTFNTHACERLSVDANVADRILNHVATATTSKIMRTYNKSELYEPRKQALADWARLIEAEVAGSSGAPQMGDIPAAEPLVLA